MDILNKSIREFSFDDIVSFCQQGISEGQQIDYKEDYPSKGFEKHLAAFSNTRGGVIIVGVRENRTSGLPETSEGVSDVAKKIEKLHQEASNVDPMPVYDVHATDEKSGKAFILIRIYEGDKTPYYVQNNSNVWIRTGNVSTPIDLISPEGLELLFGKKEKAEKSRSLSLRSAGELYKAAIERGENRRKIAYEKSKQENDGQLRVAKHPLGTNVSMFTIALQPFFPKEAFAHPKTINEKLRGLTFRMGRSEYPVYSIPFETVPNGVLNFSSSLEDGFIECHEYFGNGLIFTTTDVLRYEENNIKKVYIWTIGTRLFSVLQFAKNFYKEFGYQGSLNGSVTLEGTKDVTLIKILPTGWNDHFNQNTKGLLSSYEWELEVDTKVLNSPTHLKEYYLNFMKEICWSLGYENLQDNVMDAYLKENGFIFQ